MNRIPSILLTVAVLTVGLIPPASASMAPIVPADLVFDEADGVLAVEAEHFFQQTLAERRGWHITSSTHTPDVRPDADPAHVAGASGGAYVELLPDTRTNHDQKLIKGENFTDEPGQMAVLHYKVRIHTPGRYYVWVRAFSTGTEDNGVHVGLNGHWPESGRRWQTVQKDRWAWDCRQRTTAVHAGVAMQLFLDITQAGDHEVMFAMREDGFEMDKFVLARDQSYQPLDKGPEVKIAAGRMPASFPEVAEAAPAFAPIASAAGPVGTPLVQPRQPDGNAEVIIAGELKQWHKVTLTLDGPYAHERDTEPNAFTDLAFHVQFTHESGQPSYTVPGYFAADGRAGESSAESGTKWRAHLAPDKAGAWTYVVSFTRGKNAAISGGGQPLAPFDGRTGRFSVGPTDKTGRDFRSQGRLQYVGKHLLQFAGSKQYFLKAGPDAPETFLGYADFDNTIAGKPDKVPLKTWAPHVGDWKPGDPTWREGRGKGMIGALNYLAGKGVNAFSFLTYNAAGDGDNVWPFIQREAKQHYDCSKLDQWGTVFDHATTLGLYLHFKLQENEMDDHRRGMARKDGVIPEALDGGKLGIERKLYCREIVARFGHALALNWNIGEENTQSSDEIRAMVQFLHDIDPYRHPIVLHTFPPEQELVYEPLLGHRSLLTGVSLQNPWHKVHQRTLQWVRASAAAGRPWVVANDEQNPAGLGVPPDPGYRGHDGVAVEKTAPKGPQAEGYVSSKPYTLHDIRKLTLWGSLMAGGGGVEYYFGYALPENDLVAEDFRSRDRSWDYCRIALSFFRDEKIPVAEMQNANALIGNDRDDNSKFCLARPGELYLVYLPNGGTTDLDLSGTKGTYSVKWFNPRAGGPLVNGSVTSVAGGAPAAVGHPPAETTEDWLAVIRR